MQVHALPMRRTSDSKMMHTSSGEKACIINPFLIVRKADRGGLHLQWPPLIFKTAVLFPFWFMYSKD